MPEVERNDEAVVTVERFDRAPLSGAVRTDEGFLVAPANVARTGVLEYVNADGSIRRELRLEGDVFAPDSLATYQSRPVTRGHPGGLVSTLNARGVVVGSVSRADKADDGKHVSATVTIYDGATIKAIESGEREISLGYRSRLEPVPGRVHTYADGTTVVADYYQRNIRANHVAIVPRGRAGDSVAIRLDSVGHQTSHGENTMTPEQIAALQAENARLRAESDKVRLDAAEAIKALEKATAETEVLRAKAEESNTRLDAIEAEAALSAHKALASKVASIVGEKVDGLVRLDAAELHRKAISKLAPKISVAGKTPEFLGHVFEGLVEAAGTVVRTDSASAIAGAVLGATSGSDSLSKLAQARKDARDRVIASSARKAG